MLEKHPELRIKVYAVWFDMIWTDSKGRWPRHLIDDPRVEHFWDDEKALGRWYDRRLGDGKHVMWDTFLLYPPGASLDVPPERMLALGSTIVDEREELQKAIEALEPPPS